MVYCFTNHHDCAPLRGGQARRSGTKQGTKSTRKGSSSKVEEDKFLRQLKIVVLTGSLLLRTKRHSRKRSKKNGCFVVFCQKRLRFRSRSATFDLKTQKEPLFTSGLEWRKRMFCLLFQPWKKVRNKKIVVRLGPLKRNRVEN